MKAFIRPCAFRSIWILMVIGVIHASANGSQAQHEIFDENVIQKWKEYEVFSHSFQGTARIQRIVNGKSQEYVLRYKQNRECALSIGPHQRDPSLLFCSLGNPHYLAILDLSKTDPSNAVLHKFTPITENMGPDSILEVTSWKTSVHFYYGRTKWLRQAVSDPSFKVTKTAREIQNGQELVRVDHVYNYVLQLANRDTHVRAQGTLWLDPSRCWCIQRSKISSEVTDDGKRSADREEEVVCETIDHPSGFPILKNVTEHVKITNHKLKRNSGGTTKTEYELEVNNNVPDSEFTLSAFGLPEPAGMEPVKKPIPIYVWILLAAGVCGALAFAFRSLARRKHPADIA